MKVNAISLSLLRISVVACYALGRKLISKNNGFRANEKHARVTEGLNIQ